MLNKRQSALIVNRRYSGMPIVLLILLASLVILPSGGCARPSSEGFAIYLTRDDIKPDQMEALSHIELAAEPLITQADIAEYNAQTHEITLTKEAFERVAHAVLDIPTSGISFLVCVDQSPVYWGAFWTSISSQSFSGVVIRSPYSGRFTNTIEIQLGYPTESFYQGQDPRRNALVLKSLAAAGKLTAQQETTASSPD